LPEMQSTKADPEQVGKVMDPPGSGWRIRGSC
jgi:hypothetical protein